MGCIFHKEIYKEFRMKNKKIWLGVLVLALVLGMTFISCNQASLLISKWTPERGKNAPSGLPDYLDLFKDGTGIIENMTISWKVENGRFIMTSSSIGRT
jgi:hypothetical protein